MKKGFPKKIIGMPYGWRNLGQVSSNYVSEGVVEFESHAFCSTRAKIGKENGKLFKYCPKCLVKLNDK